MDLKKGYTVSVNLFEGTLYDDSWNFFTHFTGYRIDDSTDSEIMYKSLTMAGNNRSFTVQVSGTCQFTFSGVAAEDKTFVELMVNGKRIDGELTHEAQLVDTLWIASLVDVEKGEKVSIRIITGSLYDKGLSFNHFTGHLISHHNC